MSFLPTLQAEAGDLPGRSLQKINSLLYDGVGALNVRWFGATGDGVTDDTTAFTAALAAESVVVVPSGTYLVDGIALNANNTLIVQPDATIKWRTYTTDDNSSLVTLANGSTLTGGGTIDANQSAFTAERGAITTYPWPLARPVLSDGATGATISDISIINSFDAAIYAINSADLTVDGVRVADCGRGPQFIRSTNLSVHNLLIEDMTMVYQGSAQHAVDFSYGVNSQVRGVRLRNLAGAYVDGFHSVQISGITIEGERSGSFSDFAIEPLSGSNALVPTPLSVDGLWYGTLSNVRITGWGGGPQVEVNGCRDSQFTDILVDGRGVAAGGTAENTLGIFLREDNITPALGALFEGAQSRDRSPTAFCTFTSVVVIGCTTGFDVCGSNNRFVNCAGRGNSINGLRLKHYDSGPVTGLWGRAIPQDIEGNEFVGCDFSANGLYGMDYWAGSNNRFTSCKFNNNGQEDPPSGIGIITARYSFTQISSAAAGSITATGTLYTGQDLLHRYALVCVGGTTPTQLLRITANDASTLTLDGTLSPVPTGADYVALVDGPQGTIRLIDCEASDTQDFTMTGVGSLDPSSVADANLTNITRVMIRGGSEKFSYGQRVLLKGIATGGSSDDVIVRVQGHTIGTDHFDVEAVSLGDGSALATATLSAPEVAGTGTIAIANTDYTHGASPTPATQFGTLTGTATVFHDEVDGHYWIGINGEYRQVWRLASDTLGYTMEPFTDTTSGAFTTVKFDVEGIPCQDYGRALNRYVGTVEMVRWTAEGNITAPFLDSYSPNVTGGTIDGPLTVQRDSGEAVLVMSRTDVPNNFDVEHNLASARWNVVGNGYAVFADSAEDATSKINRFGVTHYSIAQVPFYGVGMTTVSGGNTLDLGGGTGNGVAATKVDFYAAADSTTLTGTNIGRFDFSATAGDTRFLLWDVNAAALQRVKVGANGTGPGGTGRALYLDNV